MTAQNQNLPTGLATQENFWFNIAILNYLFDKYNIVKISESATLKKEPVFDALLSPRGSLAVMQRLKKMFRFIKGSKNEIVT